jgi:hypothetical protein
MASALDTAGQVDLALRLRRHAEVDEGISRIDDQTHIEALVPRALYVLFQTSGGSVDYLPDEGRRHLALVVRFTDHAGAINTEKNRVQAEPPCACTPVRYAFGIIDANVIATGAQPTARCFAESRFVDFL